MTDTAALTTPAEAEGGRSLTPLEACLLHVTSELDRPMTHAAIYAAISDPGGEMSIEDVLHAVERVGLQAAFGPRKLSEFDSTLLPAILMGRDGRAYVLHKVHPDGRFVVFDPAMGNRPGLMMPDALAEVYAGHCILLRADYRDDLSLQNRTRGHWFWSALSASRWTYVQVMLAAMLANILGLSTSIFTMVVYDRILPNEATESLIALTIGIGIALLFDFLIKLLRAAFIDRAGKRADLIMGRRIFDQLLDIKIAARKGSTGAMTSTLREFETLREFFTSATLVTLVDLPFIGLFIYVIYLIGGPLAYVPMAAVPIVLFVCLAVQPFLSRLADQSFTDGQSKQSVLVETLNGLESIKASGASRYMRSRWETAIERQSEHSAKSRGYTQFALNATGLVQQGAQVLIIFWGVFLIAQGETSMGALIASVILMGRTLAPLAQLAQTLTRANNARTSYRSLNQLMNSDNERPHDRQWISRPQLKGEITFDDVRFSYPDQLVETLKGISLTIQPGEKVAILGKIGSGKSTLARLLLGLYDPTGGAVRVDGVDIRQIDPGDLRRNVGAALQDVWLISGTIKDNIAIGDVRPTDDAILRAARIAGVEEFVSKHPAGYDLHLAEKGEGLSGGQKQAICLARSLVANPPVMLLDEPTSSMDVQKEAEVIQNLKREMGDCTMVIITHRTSLLDLVDRVIVIDDGKVAADGPKSMLQRGKAGDAA